MNLGRLASASLMLSGVAAIAMPEQVATALSLNAGTPRGRAETRAGLGGTYAALGGWAFATDSSAARTAVGLTWLGAAAARIGAMKLDEPDTDATFWAYLGAELALGVGALAAAARRG